MTLKYPATEMISGAFRLMDKHSTYVILWCALGILADIAVMPYEGFATVRDFLLFFPAVAVETALYYYLSKRFLSAMGLPADKSDLLTYLGIALLLAMMVGISLLLLVIPGIYLWARLSIWVPILLTEERRALDVPQESFERTAGHTSAIILSHLLPMLILLPLWIISGFYPDSQMTFQLSLAVLTSAAGAYWFCLSVALYKGLTTQYRDQALENATSLSNENA